MARRCRANAALVQDSVLGYTCESSSLVVSLARVVEEIENRINTAATNLVRWGTRSALVAVLSHFPELEPELELLGCRRDVDLSNNRADALWPLVSMAQSRWCRSFPHHWPTTFRTTWSSSGVWPVVLLFCKIWQTQVAEA
jgi:hypothetical protein